MFIGNSENICKCLIGMLSFVNGNKRKFSITKRHVHCITANEVIHTHFYHLLSAIIASCGKSCTSLFQVSQSLSTSSASKLLKCCENRHEILMGFSLVKRKIDGQDKPRIWSWAESSGRFFSHKKKVAMKEELHHKSRASCNLVFLR